jgi:cytochrome b6-f complex iron-sulfur subunit
LAEPPTDLLDLAERLERSGDIGGVKTCLDLARASDPGVQSDSRFKALQERLETFLGRRKFLRGGTGFVGLMLAGVTSVGGIAFLLPPEERISTERILKIGRVDAFLTDTSRLVEFRGRTLIVVRDAAARFHALSAVCTHSDVCVVEWHSETQELVCPCHKAAFDLRGNVLEGPPPRPLPLFEVQTRQGMIFVHME